MGKLTDYGAKPTPLALTDKVLGFDNVDTFAITLQNVKDLVASGIPDHNDLGGLNEGDFLHLTAAEKASIMAAKLFYTVGTGGDYTSLEAAFTDSKYNLTLVSDITLTTNIDTGITALFTLNLNNKLLTFSTFTLTLSCSKTIISGGYLKYSSTASKNIILSSTKLQIQNCEIESTNGGIFITSTTGDYADYCKISNCRFIMANALTTIAIGSYMLESIELIGGGSSSYGFISTDAAIHIVNDLFIKGTFSTASNLIATGLSGSLHLTSVRSESVFRIQAEYIGLLTGIYCINATVRCHIMTGFRVKSVECETQLFAKSFFANGYISTPTALTNSMTFTNVTFAANVTHSGTPIIKMIGCLLTGNLTITAGTFKLYGTDIVGTLTGSPTVNL